MAENDNKPIKTEERPRGGASSKVKFEKLSLADEKEYIDFLMAAYKDQFNRERFESKELVKKFWSWEYIQNPAALEEKPLVWICRFEDKIIGQICVMPAAVKIKDRVYKGGWLQDLIFLPDSRNTGMGFFLIRHTIEQLAGILDLVMIAGTNDKSYILFKTLGFADLGFINRNVYPVDIKNIAGKIAKNKILRSFLGMSMNVFKLSRLTRRVSRRSRIDIAEEKNFGDFFDVFWRDVSEQFVAITKRDKEVLQWRFSDQPYWQYKILAAKISGVPKGYVVLRETIIKSGLLGGLKMGIVSDIMFDVNEKDVGRSLLKSAFDYFSGRVDIMRCDIMSQSVQPVVSGLGFVGMRSNNKFLAYPLCDELKPDKDRFVQDRRSWHVTFEDSDLDLF